MENKSLSFGFTKRIEKKTLTNSAVTEVEKEDDTSTDIITSVENKSIKGTKPTAEKKEYVIPLITQNKWRTGDSTSKPDENQDEAVQELLEEAAKRNEAWEVRGRSDDPNLSIPLLMKNKVPDGFETDDKLDVSLRPEEPEEADYEEIPIEQYGMAMLRGMGWKEGEGIGKNKKNVAPVVADLRPKGLGLGADRSQTAQVHNGSIKTKDEEEELTIKKGAYCVLIKGANKDLYGVIEGLDEDNARVMVKLTISGKIVTQSQHNIRLVTKKEYTKYSKYLNKGKVDEYKEKENSKKSSSRKRSRSRERSHKKSHKHRERSSERDSSKKRHKKDRSPSDDEEEKRRKVEKRLEAADVETGRKPEKNEERRKRKYDEREHQEDRSVHGRTSSNIWVRPQIKVRIVDKKYKKGAYYKTKVTVVDMAGPDNCICKTDEGTVLEGLSQSDLETVIPKSESSFVLIVHGKLKGQLAEVMKKDKKNSQALVQLLQDRHRVMTLDYDHICEFVGNINDEFEF